MIFQVSKRNPSLKAQNWAPFNILVNQTPPNKQVGDNQLDFIYIYGHFLTVPGHFAHQPNHFQYWTKKVVYLYYNAMHKSSENELNEIHEHHKMNTNITMKLNKRFPYIPVQK